jgi:His-Xaa-Ser system radical SAM maturase HxsB
VIKAVSRTFATRDTFTPSVGSYRLLPFRFHRFDQQTEILVNECGEFVIAPVGTVEKVVRRRLSASDDLYPTLKAKQFIYDDYSSPLLDVLASKYRTKFGFLYGSTKLHIFVVTLRCDHSCHYCQVSRQTVNKGEFDMTEDVARAAVKMMLRSPSRHITLELQGGEPLLAFDVIKYIVSIAKPGAAQLGKELDIVVTSNLAFLTEEILAYCKTERIKLSTSLDGPAFIHNANRPRPGGDSHRVAIEGIKRARRVLGADRVAALMTTTQLSLEHPTEIIDEYVRQSCHTIFLRPISPYGFAVKSNHRTGYEMDAFLEFYKTGLNHILELNRQGYSLVEIYTKILLEKILTPEGTGYVDLQSPSGAGLNVLVYNYDGDVYATDEARMLAEMQDHTFKLGNVMEHSRAQIFTSPAFLNLLAGACNQSLPGCSDCAFQAWCGSDPIYHHATQGDHIGHRTKSGFCKRNMKVIEHLFSLMRNGDPWIQDVFWGWITDRNLAEMKASLPQ